MRKNVRSLVYGALCIALSYGLSYIKLFSMPLGGSVTLGSMLPILLYANRFGLKNGLLCGLAYGLLQFVQKPEVFHWLQVLLDYPMAFMLLGLAACSKNLQLGCLLGGMGRLAMHTVSGAVFFGDATSLEGWWTSLAYNGSYLGVDLLLCLILSLPLLPLLKKLPSLK